MKNNRQKWARCAREGGRGRAGIGLSELLIVLAILGVLFVIAAGRHASLRTATNIAQAKADLATYAAALVAYETDHAAFPGCSAFGIPLRPPDYTETTPLILERLSTPIAYMTEAYLPSATPAVGRCAGATAASHTPNGIVTLGILFEPPYLGYWYLSGNETQRFTVSSGPMPVQPPPGFASKWIMHAPGPGGAYHNLGGVAANSSGDGGPGSTLEECLGMVYDPTNGTDSWGAIWKTGGDAESHYARQLFGAAATQSPLAPSPDLLLEALLGRLNLNVAIHDQFDTNANERLESGDLVTAINAEP